MELNTIIFKELMSTNNQSGVGLMLGEKFLFFQHDKVTFHPSLCNGQVVLSSGQCCWGNNLQMNKGNK
jgi:hypothetical protein